MKIKLLMGMALFILVIAGYYLLFDNEQIKESEMPERSVTGYSGNVLAGNKSFYLEFNHKDYEKALKEKRIVLLYFYADWCPICRAEQEDISGAFNSLERDDLIGFRVNYNDGSTDEYEDNLAKENGITYQHTKVIIVDGLHNTKSPESWNKERYLNEIGRL